MSFIVVVEIDDDQNNFSRKLGETQNDKAEL